MYILNKKKALTIFITTSFVLLTLTGCGNKVNAPINSKNDINDNKVVEQEEKQNVVESGGTLSIDYIEDITTNEVPITIQSDVMTEEETVSYFEKIEAKINEYANSDNFASLKDKASSLFITTVDFVFYNGEIKGVTFSSLSNSAKVKILNIVKRIDTTIMTKWPSYKEDIKTTSGKVYNNISDKVSTGLDYINEKIEEKIGADDYNSIKENAKDAVSDIKDAASNIYEKGKDVTGKTKEKVKSWYEEYKSKHNN